MKYLKGLLPVLCLLSLLVVFSAGFFATKQHSMVAQLANTVVLPIEVLGASGHIESVTVEIADPNNVDSLYIKGHALGFKKSDLADEIGYDKKVSVRINGGAWIPVDNQTADVYWPERVYEGIGGAYHTVRLNLPISGIKAGANSVEFRLNQTEGTSSGFRILEFDLRRGNGASAISGTTFVDDDPDSWAPPMSGAGDISAGKSLFTKRNSLNESPLPGAGLIIAACSDCHATDGRDLKYFNFSNNSIVARSVFHGLTPREGQQIASYIRSIDLELPGGYTVADAGRPWDPPYQPGPELENKPVELWAAGAGIEWVLDRDNDMLPHLFPNGHTGSGGLSVAHPDASVRNDLIPIALQLPDWNGWLPTVHPFDVYGQSGVEQLSSYQDLEYELDNLFAADRQGMIDASKNLNHRNKRAGIFRELHYTAGYGFEWAGEQEGINLTLSSRWAPENQQLDELSDHQWQAVRFWELMQRHKLEDLGDEIFKGTPSIDDKSLVGGWDRTWLVANQIIFDMAPHKHAKPYYPFDSPYPTPLQNTYFSTAWYELQMILSNGNRDTGGTNPVDWNYHHPHIGNHSSHPRSGESHNQFLRWMKSQITVQQTHNSYHGITEKRDGWDSHTIDPARILPGYNWKRVATDAPNQQIVTEVAETVLRAHMIKLLRHDIAEFPRNESQCTMPGWPGSSCTPRDEGGHPNMSSQDKHTQFFTLLARLSERGVSPTLIDSAATWGEAMWPSGNWEQWFYTGSAPPPAPNVGPSASISSPTDGISLTAPVSITVKAEASDSDGAVKKVEFFVDGSKLGEDVTAPYAVSWNETATGTYSITAKATDDDGASTSSSAVSVTVIDGGSPDDGNAPVVQEIALAAGWSLVSSLVEPADPSMEALFSSISDQTVLVKDSKGQVFVPEFDIDNIGTWNTLTGYSVYTREACTLVISGTAVDPADTPVALAEGWNIVPYLRSDPMDVANALGSISGELVLVKDYAGRLYYPAYDIDQIGELVPGNAYRVYVTSAANLVYPENESTPSGTLQTVMTGGSVDGGLATSSVLLVRSEAFADGDELSVMAPDGSVVGSGIVERGLVAISVRGDERLTGGVVEGARHKDPLVLEVRRGRDSESQPVEVDAVMDGLSGNFVGGGLSYEDNSVIVADVRLTASKDVEPEDVPASFRLGQNYPNPFNPATVISYDLAAAVHVRLEVFDALGRLVKILVDGHQQPGSHEARFEGIDLQSGVYFYTIRAGTYRASKQMLLVK